MPMIRMNPVPKTRLQRRSAWFVLLAWFAVLPLGPGCASWRAPSSFPEKEPLPDPAVLYRELLERATDIGSAKGVGHLKIHAAGRNLSLEALIACKRPARLRVEALDFWDQAVFLATIREDEFCIYFVGENRFLREPADPAVLQENVGIPLDGGDLVALVLGCPFFVPLESPELGVRREGGNLILTARELEREVRYEVRMDARRRPLQVLLSRESGKGDAALLLRVDFGKYQSVEGFDFPFRIRVTNLESREDFLLQYQQLQLNQVLEEALFQFVPPAAAERIKWQ